MSERLLVSLLAAILRYLAGDQQRWLAFYRQVRKLMLAENAQNAREGVLAIAKELEGCYNGEEIN
jgi:hypothetical protein